MKIKKLSKKELAEAHVFPHGLSEREKADADKELLRLRAEEWAARSSKEILRDRLLQFKYQMEDSMTKPA